MKPLFSVVLIAKNEAATLPRLLASLYEFQKRGGEVILVDTGSTDGTPELARSLGCKVWEEGDRFVLRISPDLAVGINDRFLAQGETQVVSEGDRVFDFAAARNYATSRASNEMIAVAGCDELFAALDLGAIEEAIRHGYKTLEHAYVHSLDAEGNEHIKFRRSYFYDRRNFKWSGIVHEVLVGEGSSVLIDEDKLKVVHHQQPKSERARYLAGLALDCFLNPDNDRNSHYLAREMLWNGRPKSAIKEFERHIAMNRWLPELAQSMIYIGDARIALGQTEAGLDCYHKAFVLDPSRREGLMRLASHYWQRLDAPRTAAYAAAALTVPLSHTYMDRMEEYTYLPHDMMYWALWWMGDRVGSKQHWLRARAYRPQHAKYIDDAVFYESAISPPSARA
jgi:glycosyltransferase involved in cell wall biosynthesis